MSCVATKDVANQDETLLDQHDRPTMDDWWSQACVTVVSRGGETFLYIDPDRIDLRRRTP
jgi:hypothetical protein